jgi:hypothetical protein
VGGTGASLVKGWASIPESYVNTGLINDIPLLNLICVARYVCRRSFSRKHLHTDMDVSFYLYGGFYISDAEVQKQAARGLDVVALVGVFPPIHPHSAIFVV